MNASANGVNLDTENTTVDTTHTVIYTLNHTINESNLEHYYTGTARNKLEYPTSNERINKIGGLPLVNSSPFSMPCSTNIAQQDRRTKQSK